MNEISARDDSADSSTEGRLTRRLWLVRHGLTTWNTQQRFCGQSDIPLSTAGRVQARWLARRLRSEKIIALYTSDLGRAHETATIILDGREQRVPMHASSGWRELHFGAWEGLTYAEIAEQFAGRMDFFSGSEWSAPPGGESPGALKRRVLDALREVLREQATAAEGDILIVSHGGTLRILLSSVLGMPLARQWQLSLDPGSLSALDILPLLDSSEPSGMLALLNSSRSNCAAPFISRRGKG